MADKIRSSNFAVNGTLACLVAMAVFALWNYTVAPCFNRPADYDTYTALHTKAKKWYDTYGVTYWRREAEQGLAGVRPLESIEDPQLRLAVQALRSYPHLPGMSWADETKMVNERIRTWNTQPDGIKPYITFGRSLYVNPVFDFTNDNERFSALRQGTFVEDETVSVREVPVDIHEAWNYPNPGDESPRRPFGLRLVGWLVYSTAFFLALLGMDRTQEMVRQSNEPGVEPLRFVDAIRPRNVYEALLWLTGLPAFLTFAALTRNLQSLPFRKKTEAERIDEVLAFAKRMAAEAISPDVRKRCTDAIPLLERSRMRVAFEPMQARLESVDDLAAQEDALEDVEREMKSSATDTTGRP